LEYARAGFRDAMPIVRPFETQKVVAGRCQRRLEIGGPDQGRPFHYGDRFCFAFVSRPEGRFYVLTADFPENFQEWSYLC
jgi:hypothetical protein